MAPIVGFVARRLLAMVVVVWVIVTIVFFLAHASPYDPIRLLLGTKGNGNPLAMQRLRHYYGLDKSVWQQYVNYLGNLLHGNLGYSEGTGTEGQPVWLLLRQGVPVSLKLGGCALLLALLIGLPIGLVSALHHNRFLDHIGQAGMIAVYAVPAFVLAPICQVIFGAQLNWLPVTGWGDPGVQGLKEMILPVTIYAAGLAGYFAVSFRSFMLEVLHQDYIRTARAKGLRLRTIVYRHALRNTLLPLVSIVGPTVSFLIVGAFIIEFFFGVPGIGYITINSINGSDYPVIEGTTIVLVVFVVVINVITDIMYAIIDPRIGL